MNWADLNKRQQEYLQAIYEVDQEQEKDEKGAWDRGQRTRPAAEWRWMEYGVFSGIGSALYTKLSLRNLIDEGTGSTFNALEKRGYIKCKYTSLRRNSGQRTDERFLMLQITPVGRKLVRSAIGEQREKPLPPGTLREWHWRAMVEVWKSRPEGVRALYDNYNDYGSIGWKTWLRLRNYKAGALIEEYSTWGKKEEWMSATPQIYWLRLTAIGEQFYREHWQHYRELYPDVDAPDPDDEKED